MPPVWLGGRWVMAGTERGPRRCFAPQYYYCRFSSVMSGFVERTGWAFLGKRRGQLLKSSLAWGELMRHEIIFPEPYRSKI